MPLFTRQWPPDGRARTASTVFGAALAHPPWPVQSPRPRSRRLVGGLCNHGACLQASASPRHERWGHYDWRPAGCPGCFPLSLERDITISSAPLLWPSPQLTRSTHTHNAPCIPSSRQPSPSRYSSPAPPPHLSSVAWTMASKKDMRRADLSMHPFQGFFFVTCLLIHQSQSFPTLSPPRRSRTVIWPVCCFDPCNLTSGPPLTVCAQVPWPALCPWPLYVSTSISERHH